MSGLTPLQNQILERVKRTGTITSHEFVKEFGERARSAITALTRKGFLTDSSYGDPRTWSITDHGRETTTTRH